MILWLASKANWMTLTSKKKTKKTKMKTKTKKTTKKEKKKKKKEKKEEKEKEGEGKDSMYSLLFQPDNTVQQRLNFKNYI